MNWIGKKRKKELSNEQKVKRGKIIFIALVIMIGVLVFLPEKDRRKSVKTDPIEEIMDSNLDSLIQSLGFTDYEVFHKGALEKLNNEEISDSEIQLEIIEQKIQQISEKKISDKQKMILLDEAIAERDRLKKEIEDNNAGSRNDSFSARRIRFSTPDGKKYTFFQEQWPDGPKVEAFHESVLKDRRIPEFE